MVFAIKYYLPKKIISCEDLWTDNSGKSVVYKTTNLSQPQKCKHRKTCLGYVAMSIPLYSHLGVGATTMWQPHKKFIEFKLASHASRAYQEIV